MNLPSVISEPEPKTPLPLFQPRRGDGSVVISCEPDELGLDVMLWESTSPFPSRCTKVVEHRIGSERVYTARFDYLPSGWYAATLVIKNPDLVRFHYAEFTVSPNAVTELDWTATEEPAR